MPPPSAPIDLETSTNTSPNIFSLSNGNLTINKTITLLSKIPSNVTFSPFSSICTSSQAPTHLFTQAQSRSHHGGFLGFTQAQSRSHHGGFLGFTQPHPSHLLTNPLGHFSDRPFLSVFRFKAWWSTMWVGSSGSHLQRETQWVLFNLHELNSYVLLIPIIEGQFRSAIHPGLDDQVVIWAESGSTQVQTSSFSAIAYVHFGHNPFDVMREAFVAIRSHLDTFRLLEEKSLPSIANKFGWCTWDAFYLTVEPGGVRHGVRDFADGGVMLRFVIIDDGWQSIDFDNGGTENDVVVVLGGQQMTGRLYRLTECERFRKYRAGTETKFDPGRTKMIISKAVEIEHAEKARCKAVRAGESSTVLSSIESELETLKKELYEMCRVGQDNVCESNWCESDVGLKAFIGDLRKEFPRLDDVYVWQALCGAWGGVRPGTTQLDSKVMPVRPSPGLVGTMEDLAVVKIVEGGIGLVRPDQAVDFYDAMHSYLSSVGITGVKVDVIHTLEFISEEYGGRIALAKAYYNGLTKSLVKNFKGTGLISSMQQCNDFFFLGTQQISFGRVGDDFWYQDPNGDPSGVYWLQGVHMVHCAYNSLWMGQTIHPDWDMFQSDHLCASFHAASRSISGGPIYVSDSVGSHDFALIKRLAFPDGTVPKCAHFALPTRDCLFTNPLFDGHTTLKIWNLNKFGGVIGAFNCQGGGWDPNENRFRGYSQFYKPVSCSIRAKDIEWDHEKETSEYAVYLNQANKLLLVASDSDSIEITVEPSSFEILHFVPVERIDGCDAKFAAIGLTNMYNSGGTVVGVEWGKKRVRSEVKGKGRLLVYSSVRPEGVVLNGLDVGFEWGSDGRLEVDVCWEGGREGVSQVVFVY